MTEKTKHLFKEPVCPAAVGATKIDHFVNSQFNTQVI